MSTTDLNAKTLDENIMRALTSDNSSHRLRAVLMLGSNPNPDYLELLMARCVVEPDFYVRDMLTWALVRFPDELTVPRLLADLNAMQAQARSQALHTLSKINRPDTWPAITRSLLHDDDEEVARSAWRAAVVLVPLEEKAALAQALSEQFGRGDRELQLSLSQALVALGGDVITPILQAAMASTNQQIQAHAKATQQLLKKAYERLG